MNPFRHALLSAGVAAIVCATASLAAVAQPGAASLGEAPAITVAQAGPAAEPGATPPSAVTPARGGASAPEAKSFVRAGAARTRAVRAVRAPRRATARRLVRPAVQPARPIRVAVLERPVVSAGG